MPTSLSNITVKDSNHSLVIKSNDITIDGTSILGQNNFADKDLSNLSTIGQNILDSKLDTTQITNCITEIPQDIKLELKDGTLTLKAGSKVYVPNGASVFDEVVITQDKSTKQTVNGVWMCFVNESGNLQRWNMKDCFSGTTAPTSVTYPMWYDTTNNIIKVSDNSGSTWTGKFSLPIAIFTITNGTITSIDQVFSGFGYIGSTVFALPGVKGLIPNGRNADGSLKNKEVTTSSVLLHSHTGDSKTYHLQIAGPSTMYGTLYRKYIEDVNYNWSTYSNEVAPDYTAGIYSTSNGKITSFTTKTTFHAVDYNDIVDTANITDNSSKIATTANVDAKITAQAVKLTGDQTIAGIKTFSNLVCCVNKHAYYHNMPGYTNGTVPSTDYYPNTMILNDSAGQYFGFYGPEMLKNGSYSVRMGVRSQVDNKKYSMLKVGCLKDGTFYTSAPTPPTSDSSSQIATTGWVNTVGNNVVHLTGNETISGTKIFTNSFPIRKQATAYVKNETPKNPQNIGIEQFIDKNGASLFYTKGYASTEGRLFWELAGTWKGDVWQQGLSVGVDVDNSIYALAPTPETNSNSTKIATTAYVNNKLQVVSALPASPDSNVFYFIPA